jgi:subtilisin-like proprotein convertase family protein
VDGNPSPNGGQLTTIGPLGVAITSFGGFDIQPGTNTAYAALRISGVSILHTINLTTGAATAIGPIGSGTAIDGLTVSGMSAGPTPTPTPTATPTPTPGAGATVSYTGPAVPIPDNIPAGVNIMLPVAGVGTVADLNFRFDTGGACDATVGNTNAAMDHTFIGDLTFRLTPPDGAPTVAFQARRGGTRENICLVNLNDEGGFPNVSTLTSVTGMPQMGDFSPETTGALSMFDGENANGTWVLNVSDNAGIDTGSLRRFSLIFNSGNAPEEQIQVSPSADTAPELNIPEGKGDTPDGIRNPGETGQGARKAPGLMSWLGWEVVTPARVENFGQSVWASELALFKPSQPASKQAGKRGVSP